ncbi:MAG: hypothetical protein RR397_10970 [Odoribacter sp.]
MMKLLRKSFLSRPKYRVVDFERACLNAVHPIEIRAIIYCPGTSFVSMAKCTIRKDGYTIDIHFDHSGRAFIADERISEFDLIFNDSANK